MHWTRREFIAGLGTAALATTGWPLQAATGLASGPRKGDRVIICNEDSNTLSVIDPTSNAIARTINLTSFDEDARPPFRLVTGGVTPTHAAMIHKPLYHGAIALHGAAPSPDSRVLACTGRGSSNLYLIDLENLRVIGNRPGPGGDGSTNAEWLTSGVMVGREPHEPTFARNGKEIWVALRGEHRFAIVATDEAISALESGGAPAPLRFLPTIAGPAQVWFSPDGALAYVISQKGSLLEVLDTNMNGDGFSRPRRRSVLDLSGLDPFGFTPFQKTSPDGRELWLSHKLADRVSGWTVTGEPRLLDAVSLGAGARPNHLEFVDNAGGSVMYVSLARVDDGGPGGVASSRIAVIDRSAAPGQRRVVGQFFTHGREAHGLWCDPDGTLLYVAHEQDELPGAPNAGQTVCSVFDVRDPIRPQHLNTIPLGHLSLPSGRLRNRKSINLVYVRPGARSQTA